MDDPESFKLHNAKPLTRCSIAPNLACLGGPASYRPEVVLRDPRAHVWAPSPCGVLGILYRGIDILGAADAFTLTPLEGRKSEDEGRGGIVTMMLLQVERKRTEVGFSCLSQRRGSGPCIPDRRPASSFLFSYSLAPGAREGQCCEKRMQFSFLSSAKRSPSPLCQARVRVTQAEQSSTRNPAPALRETHKMWQCSACQNGMD